MMVVEEYSCFSLLNFIISKQLKNNHFLSKGKAELIFLKMTEENFGFGCQLNSTNIYIFNTLMCSIGLCISNP
jgi:hypothetical protein